MTKRNGFTLFLLTLIGGLASGSTISSVTPSSLPAAANGTSYTVTLTPGGYSVDGDGMAGITVTALFSSGANTSQTCTWTSSDTCSVINQFSISTGTGGSPGTVDTDPAAGSLASSIWTVTNARSIGNLLSITISGIPGLIDFDLCTVTPGITLDNTNQSGSDCSGGGSVEGTTNSNVGYSAHTAAGGTTNDTATAVYSNELHLNAAAPVGDIWGTLTLTFGTGANLFTNGQTFTFGADTDNLATAVANVPEPTSLALAGGALLGLGALRLRRRRTPRA